MYDLAGANLGDLKGEVRRMSSVGCMDVWSIYICVCVYLSVCVCVCVCVCRGGGVNGWIGPVYIHTAMAGIARHWSTGQFLTTSSYPHHPPQPQAKVFLRKGLGLIQQHYPERSRVIIIANAPIWSVSLPPRLPV